MTEEFNMDWKAESDQLNLAHKTKTRSQAVAEMNEWMNV